MRTTRYVPILLAAALAVAAAPATSTSGGASVGSESRGWFAPEDLTLGNVAQEQGRWVRWVDTPPTQDTGSVLVAGGAVSPIRQNTHGDDAEHKTQFTAAGTHTGDLDSIALDLHFLRPHGEAPCDLDTEAGLRVGVDLEVDGVRVLDMANAPDGYSNYVPVTVARTDTGFVARLQVVNIHDRMAADGLTGGPETEHDLRIAVQQFHICDETIWRYGSVDAPSSVVFNRDPADPSLDDHTRIDASDPPPGDPPTLEAPELPLP